MLKCIDHVFLQRNLETNANEARTENAATRGVKMFLHRVEFYGTLLTRFIEYVLHPLKTKFSTSGNENPEFEAVKEKMQQLKVGFYSRAHGISQIRCWYLVQYNAISLLSKCFVLLFLKL